MLTGKLFNRAVVRFTKPLYTGVEYLTTSKRSMTCSGTACLLTSVLQGIPVVENPFLFAICILILMEYWILQHVRLSRFGSEGILDDYAVSVLLQRGK
jgi:hypothetical protein